MTEFEHIYQYDDMLYQDKDYEADGFWRQHLPPGGLFVFDVWFGQGMQERPTDRFKMVEVDDERIMRFAYPELDEPYSACELQNPAALVTRLA